MQTIKDQIAALQAEREGLRQDKAFADIDREHYWPEHQRISKAISRLEELLPSNFYSPEPAPLSPLDKARKALQRELTSQIENLRTAGLRDAAGHRNYGEEKRVGVILYNAVRQAGHAQSLEVLQRIKTETAENLAFTNINPQKKAA